MSYQSYTPGSSWDYDGTELPYLAFTSADTQVSQTMYQDLMSGKPIVYRLIYESMEERAANKEDARIKVETYSVNILVFAGAKDQMWQSDHAAEQIKEAYPNQTQLFIYPDAGHLFSAPEQIGNIMLGGTLEANQAAKTASDAELEKFLSQWHGQ